MHDHSWLSSIHHSSSPPYVTSTAHGIGHSVTLKVRAALDVPVEQVFIRTAPDGEQALTAMRRLPDGPACQWWEGEMRLSMPRTGYRFLLRTADLTCWLTAAGVVRHTPTDATDFKLLANYRAPHWVQESVFYQIFPDRFADGDPSNNVRDDEYLCYGRPVVARAWDEMPQRDSGGREFFGGDLEGIVQKLSYLDELGVTALYLNPIFTAPSSHKYDVADFEQVDPHFGGNEALARLREALDERGMRLVLDIVPNHCGATHHWFLEAQANPSAPTAEFFTFHRYPDEYESWLGVKSLPKLNYRSVALRERMYGGDNAIMRRWLRPPYRVDGWRIDVANMLARQGESQFGHKIGRGIRRAMKAENPEMYLLGEHFFDATPHLQGEELDASMNYRGFAFPLLQWLYPRKPLAAQEPPRADFYPLDTADLAGQWQAFLSAIPWQIALQQLNLLGSHDTPRVLTMVGEDEPRALLAATILFTFPGVPSIYYGDEIGLAGGRDPDSRRPMLWDPAQWNQAIREHYRKLIGLRRGSAALKRGGFQILHAAGQTIAYQREAPGERLVVVARRAADDLDVLPVRHGGIPDGARFRDILSNRETTVENGRLHIGAAQSAGAQVWAEI
jgi:alpha-glucosidase